MQYEKQVFFALPTADGSWLIADPYRYPKLEVFSYLSLRRTGLEQVRHSDK